MAIENPLVDHLVRWFLQTILSQGISIVRLECQKLPSNLHLDNYDFPAVRLISIDPRLMFPEGNALPLLVIQFDIVMSPPLPASYKLPWLTLPVGKGGSLWACTLPIPLSLSIGFYPTRWCSTETHTCMYTIIIVFMITISIYLLTIYVTTDMYI